MELLLSIPRSTFVSYSSSQNCHYHVPNCLNQKTGGIWVAQVVEYLTLDFGSGHDLTVCGIEPCVRLCADGSEPAWDFLFLSLSLRVCVCVCVSVSLSLSLSALPCSFSLSLLSPSLKINK